MPEILTARLRMRPPEPGDLDGLFGAWGDPDVTRYLPGGRARTRDEVERGLTSLIEHWRAHGFGFWSLLLRRDGTWIGYCGLQYLDDGPEVELAYGLAKRWWEQGYTTEAARAAVRHGFETLALDRIVAIAVRAHTASRRVMEHAGLDYEKDAHYYGLDVAYYALNDADWQPGDEPYQFRP